MNEMEAAAYMNGLRSGPMITPERLPDNAILADQYKMQNCPECSQRLNCIEDYVGGGSHYYVFMCLCCNGHYEFDTYSFKLRTMKNMNAMENTHLKIETLIDGKRVGLQDIYDPFLHNRTYFEPSIWRRLKILFTGRVLFEVKIRGDDEAHRQWFRTDKIKGNERYGEYPPKI